MTGVLSYTVTACESAWRRSVLVLMSGTPGLYSEAVVDYGQDDDDDGDA